LDGSDFQGRTLHVRVDRDEAAPDPPGKKQQTPKHQQKHDVDGLPNTTIYAGNLSFDCRWQDLKTLFQACGRVEHVEIVENPATKKSKGYGLVQFLTAHDAQRAIDKVDGTTFQGRKIRVDWDKKNNPQSNNQNSDDVGENKAKSPKQATPKRKERKELPAPSLDGALSCPR